MRWRPARASMREMRSVRKVRETSRPPWIRMSSASRDSSLGTHLRAGGRQQCQAVCPPAVARATATLCCACVAGFCREKGVHLQDLPQPRVEHLRAHRAGMTLDACMLQAWNASHLARPLGQKRVRTLSTATFSFFFPRFRVSATSAQSLACSACAQCSCFWTCRPPATPPAMTRICAETGTGL